MAGKKGGKSPKKGGKKGKGGKSPKKNKKADDGPPQIKLVEGMALAELEAEHPEELTVMEGEELQVLVIAAPIGWVRCRNSSWREGEAGGEGLVPRSHMQVGAPPKVMALSDEAKMAAEAGDLELVLVWLDRHNGSVDAKWRATRLTMLMLAAKHGHFRTVEVLLERGASTDLQDEAGNTALLYAALRRQRGYGWHEDHTRCCQMLLGAGANGEIQNNDGKTAVSLMNPISVFGLQRSAYSALPGRRGQQAAWLPTSLAESGSLASIRWQQ